MRRTSTSACATSTATSGACSRTGGRAGGGLRPRLPRPEQRRVHVTNPDPTSRHAARQLRASLRGPGAQLRRRRVHGRPRFSRQLVADGVSYRWSRLQGNFEGFFREDNGQSDPGITSLYDFPTNDPSYTAIGGPQFGYQGDIRYLGALGAGRCRSTARTSSRSPATAPSTTFVGGAVLQHGLGQAADRAAALSPTATRARSH